MEQNNQKIILVSFVALAATAGYVAKVLIDVMAASAGWFARLHDSDFVAHILPALIGIGFFVLFVSKASIRKWADEVVVEVKKVVWPTRKDTQALTVAVTFIILLAGVLLGTFDVLSRGMVNFILNFNF